MNINIKHLFLVFIITFLSAIPLPGNAVITEPEMVDYTAYPAFTINIVEPNILIVLDVSGSMQFPAYTGCDLLNFSYSTKVAECGSGTSSYDYDSSLKYYGYFKIDKYYRYGTNKFEEQTACNDTDNKIGKAGCISGNLLNWATMSRIDLMRKVLMGGKSASTQGNAHTLRGEGGRRTYSDSTLDCTFELSGGTFPNLAHTLTISNYGLGTCAVGTLSGADVQIDVPENERRGIIHRLSDKDYNGTWDDDSPRFGLMVFSNGKNASEARLGEMKVGIEGANMSSFLTALEGEAPYHGSTPGEALREAYDYYRQINSNSYEDNNAYLGGQGSLQDPMCDNGTMIGCRKNFVLLISDGDWNGKIDPVIPARENFINDIRSDIDEKQNIITYTVYTAFGEEDAGGRNSLQQVAMFGDFEDFDSNTWPYDRAAYPADSRAVTLPASPCPDTIATPLASRADGCNEWDKNANGIPDNFYEATGGSNLEAALLEAITDMLKRASSGTAVSVLSTSGEGEGAVYQAYFLPEKMEGIEHRNWLGYMQALFVDKYGNLREDTNGNNALDMSSDKILSMTYTTNEGTKVYKCSDSNGDGAIDSCPSTPEEFDSIKAIWRGGESLWSKPPASRNIFTTIDGVTELDFIEANSTDLKPWLRASDSDATEVTNIIKWVRGDDLAGVTDANHLTGYRERTITIPPVTGTTNTWKLGDIINSTPVTVARPAENFDLAYSDTTYSRFRSVNINRRQVVYVGANDGMLHAFNAGCYDSVNHQFYADVNAVGKCYSGGSNTLGDELWAFIPRSLLPHMKWLTDPDYTHVYYTDLKPYVTDVKIFNSGTHTEGWGTILIGGMRMGGKDISWTRSSTDYSASPEYFAIDISDPLNPELLWSFTHADLGLTMSKPTIVKIGTTWYAIFGSGATDYNSGSNLTTYQNGNIFVIKISGGADGKIAAWVENTNFWKISTGNSNAFMAHPITLDINSDFNDDIMYIGENIATITGPANNQVTTWNTLMRRITTSEGTMSDPANWVLSTLANVDDIDGSGNYDVVRRITSSPSASMDSRGKLWVFFGTGQFYGSGDKNQTDTGGFYAMRDECWRGNCTTSYSDLLDASVSAVDTDGNVSGVSGNCSSAATSTWPSLLSGSYGCDGWSIFFDRVGESIDFTGESLSHPGERVTSSPLVFGGLVTWTTYIPGIDTCAFEGESNLYAVFYKTGTAFTKYVFKEQKEQANPSSTVARVKNLGKGMPSSVSAQITASGTIKGFAQQSTGAIAELEADPAVKINSRLTGWVGEENK